MNQKKNDLIKHINRLQGQLTAVKTQLERSEPDCIKAANTLRASARSFSSLRMAFVDCFLEKHYLKYPEKSIDDTYGALLSVISS